MNDLIQLIKILEPNELKYINDYIDTLEFSDCKVFGSKGKNLVKSDIRSSSGLTLNDSTKATILLHQRINVGLETYHKKVKSVHKNFSYYPVPCGIGTKCWREGIQVLEYEPGQRYRYHHDAATDKNLAEYERKISVILYLNEGFEGGGTEFIHTALKPKPGYAIIFPSNWCYPHAGQKVISGKKRIAVTWYYVDWA